MTREEELDEPCPGCGHHPTLMVYESIHAVGESDPVDEVAAGGECPECGLRFVNDAVREVANDDR